MVRQDASELSLWCMYTSPRTHVARSFETQTIAWMLPKQKDKWTLVRGKRSHRARNAGNSKKVTKKLTRMVHNQEMSRNTKKKERPIREPAREKSAIKHKGAGRTRSRRTLPQNPAPKKGQNGALRLPWSRREICTRNPPVSETKFLDDFWGSLSLPAPLFGLPQMGV